MGDIVEAVLWTLALFVLFLVFIGLAWVLTGILESLCEVLCVRW